MKIQPGKPDEHGVRYCDVRCEHYRYEWCAINNNVESWDDDYDDISGRICEPWMRVVVKCATAAVADWTKDHDITWDTPELMGDLEDVLTTDEIEVE